MNESLDAARGVLAHPHLSLLAMLEAAHALRLADALPCPHGINLIRHIEAGGMRPWLRLALGQDTALSLEGVGLGGLSLEALISEPLGRRSRPAISYTAAEIPAMVMVDALCAGAGSSRWSVLASLRNKVPRHMLQQAGLACDPEEGAVNSPPIARDMEAVLDRIAWMHSLQPRKAVADLSLWRERTTTPVVKALHSRIQSELSPGSVRVWDAIDLHLDDGSQASLHSGDPELWPETIAVGDQLSMVFRGATDGHGGYLARVENLSRQAAKASLDSLRCFQEAQASCSPSDPPFESLQPLDAEGDLLAMGGLVTLMYDCQEARRGDQGRVVETCGSMVVVDFGRDSAQAVPCHGEAVRKAGATDAMAQA